MNSNAVRFVRDVLIVIVSVAASSAIAYRITRSQQRRPSLVRATRFELIDGSGRIVAGLEPSPDGPRLRFIDQEGRSRIELGMHGDESPYVVLIGNDKRPRVSIRVDSFGNPNVTMSDDQWDGRLSLGAHPSDLPAVGPLPDWGLFLNPSRHDNYASVWVSGNRAGVIARSKQK